ncbi:GntR family transcriptional regulator [Candidatus Stoquefichus massiliensis]|uniref:GntR family transcriptional regulator n=1 Tax=Candidatus Stoquefichus massiliensis TaxID=1470350 RepID=UPI0004870AE4|nr:GntR family transcriptional regulator [Candidatus Stoquefichus massiliensis]
MKLDDNNSMPLYLQLKNTIKGLIDSGEIQKGEKIPSENELCKKYDVSRITVRNALADLENEGYLIKKQGKGTFATTPKLFRPLEDSVGFSESCKNAGMQSSSVVLKREIHPMDDRMKDILKLDDNDQVLYIQRLRLADGIPLMIENNYYSYQKYGFLYNEPLTGSLYELLAEKKGIICDRSLKTVITVTTASGDLVKILQVPIGAPLFVMDGIMGDEHGEPVHYSLQYIVGEKYSFVR